MRLDAKSCVECTSWAQKDSLYGQRRNEDALDPLRIVNGQSLQAADLKGNEASRSNDVEASMSTLIDGLRAETVHKLHKS